MNPELCRPSRSVYVTLDHSSIGTWSFFVCDVWSSAMQAQWKLPVCLLAGFFGFLYHYTVLMLPISVVISNTGCYGRHGVSSFATSSPHNNFASSTQNRQTVCVCVCVVYVHVWDVTCVCCVCICVWCGVCVCDRCIIMWQCSVQTYQYVCMYMLN